MTLFSNKIVTELKENPFKRHFGNTPLFHTVSGFGSRKEEKHIKTS